MPLNNPPPNILAGIDLGDGKLLALHDEGDRVTVKVESWLVGSPVIEDDSGATPVFTPVALRFFGVRRLQTSDELRARGTPRGSG